MLVYKYLCLLYLVAITSSFDAGFLQLAPRNVAADEDTTHYAITVCAICRVTVDFLKSFYNIDTSAFETKFNRTDGKCASTIIRDVVQLIRSPQTRGANANDFPFLVKQIASTNTKTDLKEMFTEESHFDSESFSDGSALILKRYQTAVNSVKNLDNNDQARKSFGEMLHTLQDFYSHSNYIELGYSSPNEDLGRRKIQPNQYAAKSVRTCVSCQGSDCQSKPNIDERILKEKILTSGYFIPVGVSLFTKSKPKGKCSHGGLPDSSSRDEPTGGINKDKLKSEHGNLHYQAAFMAYRATVKVLEQFRRDIGDDSFSLFLTLKKNLNTLVIAIDTECSISNYLTLTKRVSSEIISQYTKLDYAPHNYMLIVFNGDQSTLLVRSRKPEDLLFKIQNLTACSPSTTRSGNLYYQSIVTSLKYCEYGSVVYTFTDSPARDAYLKDQSRALLRSKEVVIYSFLGTELKKIQPKIQNDIIDPLDGKNNDLDLASITGGLTFPITNDDNEVISNFIVRRLDWKRIQTITMFKPIGGSIDFHIDPTMDELLIDIISTDNLNDISKFQLVGPNNQNYSLTNSSSKTRYINMWRNYNPTPGIWKMNIVNTSTLVNYYVQIQAKTSFGCYSTLQKQMESTADSSGYTDLTNEPLINSIIFVSTSCDMTSTFTPTIQLIDEFGRNISNHSPLQIGASEIFTQIRVPNQKFRIKTIIRLPNGTIFQRIGKRLICPTIFSVELLDQPYVIAPGETIQMNYTIRSGLRTGTAIRLQIFDTLNLLNAESSGRNITFTNETVGSFFMTLPNQTSETSIINMVTFAVSTQDEKSGRFIYQNDETVPVYLDLNTGICLKGVPSLLIFCMALFYSIIEYFN